MDDPGILTNARSEMFNEELLITFSFRHVAWMVKKAGATVPRSAQGLRPLIRCAENIVCWWIWEHAKRGPSDIMTFPGDTALPQVLFPVALWLGTQEYAGIWRHGGGTRQDGRLGHFSMEELMGDVGDLHGAAFMSAMDTFQRGYCEEVVRVAMISLFFLYFSLCHSVPLLPLHSAPSPTHNPPIFQYFVDCCRASLFSAPLC